jgi:hypothetical protein
MSIGKYFIQLCQMFVAAGAVQNFGILSHAVMTLTLSNCRIPSKFVLRQEDDVPVVVPRNSGWCEEFYSTYGSICKSINLALADECPNFDKAFGYSTTRKMLGIIFNTRDLTWSLPVDKRNKRISAILELLSQVTLLQVQLLMSRLNYILSMCSFLKIFK